MESGGKQEAKETPEAELGVWVWEGTKTGNQRLTWTSEQARLRFRLPSTPQWPHVCLLTVDAAVLQVLCTHLQYRDCHVGLPCKSSNSSSWPFLAQEHISFLSQNMLHSTRFLMQCQVRPSSLPSSLFLRFAVRKPLLPHAPVAHVQSADLASPLEGEPSGQIK